MSVVKVPLQDLEVAPPFSTLFPLDEDLVAEIAASMRKSGYDAAKPLRVWNGAFGKEGRLVIVEGNQRYMAARRARLAEVPIDLREYPDVTSAFKDAVIEQRRRRNLGRDQIAVFTLRSVRELREAGGRRPKAAELAKLLGVAKPTVDRANRIVDDGGDELIDRVLHHGLGLQEAYTEMLARRREREERRASANSKPKPRTRRRGPEPTVNELLVALEEARHRLAEHPARDEFVQVAAAVQALAAEVRQEAALREDVGLAVALALAAEHDHQDAAEMLAAQAA